MVVVLGSLLIAGPVASLPVSSVFAPAISSHFCPLFFLSPGAVVHHLYYLEWCRLPWASGGAGCPVSWTEFHHSRSVLPVISFFHFAFCLPVVPPGLLVMFPLGCGGQSVEH